MKTNLFKKALKAVSTVVNRNSTKPAVKIITAPVKAEPANRTLQPIFTDGEFDGFNFSHSVVGKIYDLEEECGDLSCEVDNNPDNPINQFIELCDLDDHHAKTFKAMLSAGFDFVEALEEMHSGNWELHEGITEEELADRFLEEDGICLGDFANYFNLEKYVKDRAESEDGILTEYGYLYKF